MLYEANIQVTTTKRVKESKYKDNNRVLSFEDLIGICLSNVEKWKDFNYTIEQEESIKSMINKQIDKHQEHNFVKEFYEKRLKNN